MSNTATSQYEIHHGTFADHAGDSMQAALVFADPPYNIGFSDYGGGYDDRADEAEYERLISTAARFAARHLRDGGVFMLMVHASYMHRVDWWLNLTTPLDYRRTIIWHYTFGQQRKTDYTPSYTPILVYQKRGGDYIFNRKDVLVPSWRAQNGDKRCANAKGKSPDDVWRFPRLVGNAKERVGWHPCQLPLALVERAVLAHTNEGDLVVDPFCGSATSIVAAVKHGRRAIGFDINEDYVTRGRERVEAVLQDIGQSSAIAGRE